MAAKPPLRKAVTEAVMELPVVNQPVLVNCGGCAPAVGRVTEVKVLV